MSRNPVITGNLNWLISSQCENAACVGVARHDDYILIRNTSDAEGLVARFTKQEWNAFLAGVKLGDFDDVAL